MKSEKIELFSGEIQPKHWNAKVREIRAIRGIPFSKIKVFFVPISLLGKILRVYGNFVSTYNFPYVNLDVPPFQRPPKGFQT